MKRIEDCVNNFKDDSILEKDVETSGYMAKPIEVKIFYKTRKKQEKK